MGMSDSTRVAEIRRMTEIAREVLNLEEKPFPFGLETMSALREKVTELREQNELLRKLLAYYLATSAESEGHEGEVL